MGMSRQLAYADPMLPDNFFTITGDSQGHLLRPVGIADRTREALPFAKE